MVYINFFCKSVNFSSFSCISELLCEDGEDKKGWKVVSSVVDKHELTGVFSFFFFFFFCGSSHFILTFARLSSAPMEMNVKQRDKPWH